MITTLQGVLLVAIFSLATIITRSLAFVAFPAHKTTPAFVVYLGKVLPFAITAMLIVYCLKDVSLLAAPHGLPELLAILLVAGLFLLLKNSLIAIAAGTIVYMVLVQAVFV